MLKQEYSTSIDSSHLKKASKMKIIDVTNYLETIAPPDLQEGYDNSGFIVGHPMNDVTGVLCALDSTEEVIDEAIARHCNLVVAHHPIIFRGLKSITGRTYVERVIMKAIQNGITVYSIHTNLDNVIIDGVNQRIAQQLNLIAEGPLRPKLHSDDRVIGSGILATLPKPMNEVDFLHDVKEKLQCGCIKHTELLGQTIERVAICGGSGQFLLQDAQTAGAQVFITSDFKYHEYFDADGKIVIADVGHYESEQFTADLLHRLISEKFSTFAAYISEIRTNPIHYLV